MNRRDFLRSTAAASAGFVFPKATGSLSQAAPSEGWRTFEVKTRVEILKPAGTTRVWLPGALLGKAPFQRTLANEFSEADSDIYVSALLGSGFVLAVMTLLVLAAAKFMLIRMQRQCGS